MKIKALTAAAASALTLALCSTGLTASAYTADDVANKARSAGWPEYLIQMGYNEWASGKYSQEALDKAYASVSTYNDDMREAVANSLGVDPDDLPDSTTAPPQTTAPAATTTTTAPQEAGNVSGTDGTSATAASTAPAATETVPAEQTLIVTKTDGTQEPRVSKADFVNMTLTEKQAYVSSLTEESKKEFVASLSNAERNSLLKQLPADEKAALIQNYIDAAGTMGLDVTVDSLSGDQISLSMRNEEGQVVGMTNVGGAVDETGISHTKQFAAAAAGIVLALTGFGVLARRMRREDQ